MSLTKEPRIKAFDSLRGLAALGVLIFHYAGHFHARPLDSLLAPIYDHGGYFVDFFFVLSGVVLARAYTPVGGSVSLPTLIKLRIARLFPLHLITLLVVVVLQCFLVYILKYDCPFIFEFGFDIRHFIINLFLLSGIYMDNALVFNGPSWSVSVELWVNLSFFMLLGLPESRRARAFLYILIFSLSLQRLCSSSISSAVSLGNFLPRGLIGFYFGVLTHGFIQVWFCFARPSYLYDFLFVAGMLCTYFIMADSFDISSLPGVDFLLPVLVFPMILIATVGGKYCSLFLTLEALVWLGRISFSLYLVHFPIQLAIHVISVWSNYTPDWHSAVNLVVFIFGVVLIAAYTRRYIEIPGNIAAKRFFGVS